MIRKSVVVAVAGLATTCGAAFGDDAARAYEAELRADAALRMSEAAAGAGWEKGKFYISDGDANTLNFGGWAQFRYLMNFRDGSANSDDDFTHGFQTQRTRLIASGTIASKDLYYEIEGEFNRTTGNFGLLNAFARFSFENGVTVRAGQYKVNLNREQNVSDPRQLAVDRSVVDQVFGQSRSQGVGVGYSGESFRASGDFTDGAGTLNTTFDSPSEADLALTGRADFKWGEADWKQFDSFSSWRGNKYGGMAGLAAHYQSGGSTGVGPTNDVDFLQVTGDVTTQGDGWNVFLAGVWRSTETPTLDADDMGVVLQGGYFISDQTELFARYDVVIPDDSRTNSENFNTVTAGVNYFLFPKSQAAKFTADVVWFLNDQASSSSLVGTSNSQPLLSSAEDNQFSLRAQFQLMF